jgi:hypothetical protein
VLLGGAAVAVLAIGAVSLALVASQLQQPTVTVSATPSASAVATASSEASAAPTPRTTPPGTPAPTPEAALSDAASAEIKTTPAPPATPTPTPEQGLWRIQGYVVDESEQPLEGVCVVVGPHGCKPFSPHTDERGHWFLDVAAGQDTAFDFYFEIPGHKTVWWHSRPNGPVEFNVVLRKG